MAIFANSTDKSAPRGYPWMWYIRFAQILLTLIVVALAARVAASISNSDSIDCRVPQKVVWNIVCGVFAFIGLIYFLLSTGPSDAFKCLPWLIWIQLGIDAVMFIFWIAAAATSPLNCDDLCNACPNDRAILYYLSYENLFCACRGDYHFGNILKRSNSLETRRQRNVGSGHKTGILAAKTAINAILVVLSAIALLATIGWIFLGRNQHNEEETAASKTQPPPSDPESGFPMAAAQHPGTVVPGPQQGQYLTGQVQPQPQPAFTSSVLQQPPQPQPQLPVYDQSSPAGLHPQAQYEVPQQPKY